ncbi:MAG: type II toxin-antitoxin system HicB family antitoxin [Proteobacteria bacterium]|nr:type II toxin-antitoxin system HicB family antitoxin [Pseudomonadota bacterium]MBI3498941.1 type II toxin-antitoxin system HicB family antitoxin [Pseudomonadota bacterium]
MVAKVFHTILFQEPSAAPSDGWGVIFPDFPGCVSQGDTTNAAIANGKEALELLLEVMAEEGRTIPEPIDLEETPDWVQEIPMGRIWHALIPIEPPGRSIRINITMDEGLISRVDEAAKREGTSRSGYLAEAARQKLDGWHRDMTGRIASDAGRSLSEAGTYEKGSRARPTTKASRRGA